MPAHAVKGVFISYAREDRGPVMLAARLLRAGGATVFLDVHDIADGEKWETALQRAIEGCERIMVFWSAAAAASQWVEREWRAGLSLNKRIVPLMLDATPLPPALAEYQGVPDLMAMLDEARRDDAVAVMPAPLAPRPAAMPRRSTWWPMGAGVAVSVLVVVLVQRLFRVEDPGAQSVPADGLPKPPVGASAPASGLPGNVELSAASGTVGFLLAVIGLAALLLVWRLRRRREAARSEDESREGLPTRAQADPLDLATRFTNAVLG
jgi:hypothetical protein